MAETILIWLAKQALGYAVGYLAKKLGFEKAQAHILNEIENARRLTLDANPSLLHTNNPNKEIV